MSTVITRIYDHYSDVRAVITTLRAYGIDSGNISVIAHEDHHRDDMPAGVDVDRLGGTSAGTGAAVGATIGGGAGVLTGLGLMAIPGVGPLVAAGWLATAAVGALTGAATGAMAGGITDALSSNGLNAQDAEAYAEAVRRGSILVSVKADSEHESRVRATMDLHNPADLSVRRSAWTKDGWTNYDASARPYSAEERKTELMRWL